MLTKNTQNNKTKAQHLKEKYPKFVFRTCENCRQFPSKRLELVSNM